MKILVTGGLGFIGSNFIHEAINKHGCKILNYDKITYSANPNNLKGIDNLKNYKFVKGNICDKDLFYNKIINFHPDILINFAAESHVDRSIDSAKDFIDTNILGTINLLDCCLDYWRTNKVDNFKFIHISTDEVYGALGDKGSFNELSTYNPSSPYSASKASSDHFVHSWYTTYGLPTITTNCSNNYGPFQFPEKLVPLMIINALSDATLPIYGNGKNVRDWIHVQDHCDAIINIIESGKIGEKYNIGGNCELTNIQIVNKICIILDALKPRKCRSSYSKLIEFVDDRPGHDYRYAVNFDKIRNSLGWSPQINFETGIRETINWYIENSNWWKNIIKNKYKLERLGRAK